MSCPSDFVLDEIVAGARPRDGHVEACASCRERLARFARIAESARPKVAALVARAEQQRAAQRGGAWRWWSLGAALAAAATVLLLVGRPADEVRVKGTGVTVQMYRLRAGEVAPAPSGDHFRAGDALRFVVTAPRASGYALAEVEAGGKITVHQRGQLPAGTTPLEGSLVLDASPNTEWFVLLVDPKDPLVAIREHEGIWMEIRK